jgi:hypothetical protein
MVKVLNELQARHRGLNRRGEVTADHATRTNAAENGICPEVRKRDTLPVRSDRMNEMNAVNRRDRVVHGIAGCGYSPHLEGATKTPPAPQMREIGRCDAPACRLGTAMLPRKADRPSVTLGVHEE